MLFRSKVSAEAFRQQDKLAQLKKDLDGLTVTSPLAGTVYYGAYTKGAWNGVDDAAKALKPGAKLPAGQSVMTVVAAGLTPTVKAFAPESDFAKLKAGTPYRLNPGKAGVYYGRELHSTATPVNTRYLRVTGTDLENIERLRIDAATGKIQRIYGRQTGAPAAIVR